MTNVKKIPKTGYITLPNGCSLFWEPNEVGGRRYYSDECGAPTLVWDTALTDQASLMAAMTQEAVIAFNERYWKDKDDQFGGGAHADG